MNQGVIAQIIGPVLDIDFPNGKLPAILNAIKVPRTNLEGKQEDLIVEVQQHLGEDRVRAVAMDSTDGLLRGMAAVDLGSAIKMPIGEDVKGRVFNVVGDAIDGIANLDKSNGRPIHNTPPRFEDLSTEAE